MNSNILLYLVCPLALYSQKYEFNYKCMDNEMILQGTQKGKKSLNYVYLHTQNPNTVAYDYGYATNVNRLLVVDYPKDSVWVFDRRKSIDNSKLKLEDAYSLNHNEDEITISRIAITALGNYYTLKTYESDESVRPNLIVEIEMIPSHFELRPFRFMNLSDHLHSQIYDALLSKLPSPFFRIKTVKTNYIDGTIIYNDYANCGSQPTSFDLSKVARK